jgi:agmatinase
MCGSKMQEPFAGNVTSLNGGCAVSRTDEAMKTAPLTGLSTFMGLPHTNTVSTPEIAIVGIPFDNGGNPGSRYGPRAIREASTTLRGVDGPSGIDPRQHRRIYDWGNLAVMPTAAQMSHNAIRNQFAALHTAGVRTLGLGGDHSVTLPELRACSKVYPKLSLVHFDSHADTYDTSYGGGEYVLRHNAGTLFRRAVEEKLIDPAHSIQIGMRGTLYTSFDWDDARELGLEVMTTDDLLCLDPGAFAEHVAARTDGRPVFLSFDVDFFDAACVPGVGTPEPGGPTAREGLRYLRALRGQPIVSADVVEVRPPQDVASVTSTLAAHVSFLLLVMMATTPRP